MAATHSRLGFWCLGRGLGFRDLAGKLGGGVLRVTSFVRNYRAA